MSIWASHEPFLQSRAQLLVLPVSSDGNIAHPVAARCKSLFPDNYDHYHKKAIAGELALGDVLMFRLAKQLTGLGVQTGGVDYVASLVLQKFPEHPISERQFRLCLTNLKPEIYELMRYQGIRRVALLGSALIKVPIDENSKVIYLNAERILRLCHEILGDVPKLTIEVHFGKDTPLPVLQTV